MEQNKSLFRGYKKYILIAIAVIIVLAVAGFFFAGKGKNMGGSGSNNKGTQTSKGTNGINSSKGSSTSISPIINNSATSTVAGGGHSSSGITSSTTSYTTTKSGSTNSSGGNLTNESLQKFNYTYCVGNGGSRPNATYYSTLSAAGIGSWNATTDYPVPILGAGCSISGNYIYCVGSAEVLNGSAGPTYYAPISNEGIGSWRPTTNYPIPFSFGGCSISNNYIYCVGGGNYNSSYAAYYAPVSNSGIGTWKSTTRYPTGLYDAGCTISNNYIYCVGSGYLANISSANITSLQDVYYAPVSSSGIGNWIPATMYPVPFYGAGCSIYKSRIYCVGNGYSYLGSSSSAYYTNITGSGALGQWKQTTGYPVRLSNAGCTMYNGYIYCVGSSSGNDTELTYYAPLAQNGVGTWTGTTSYPAPIFFAYCTTPGSSGGFYSG